MLSPRSRSLASSTTLLLAAALVLLVSGGGGTASAQSAPDAPVTLFAAVDCNGCAAAEGVAGLARYRHVFFNPWDHQLARQVKARGTGTKVYAYKDMSSARNAGPWMACQPATPANTGVSYAEAQANPDWFLLDRQGRRIEWGPWPGCWQMDVGHPGYQQRWFENVVADLRQHGWDGVFIDNANTGAVVNGQNVWPYWDVTPAKYPTIESFRAANRSFLAYVGPRLKAAGFLVMPNIQPTPSADVALWEDWTQFTSGGVQQYLVRWECDGCYFDEDGWNWTQSLFERMQQRGRIFLTGSPVIEKPRDARLCRASFLIGWDGRSDSAVGCGEHSPEWTFEIGAPTGPRVRIGSVWRRDYTRGVALVNVSSRQSQTLALGAGYLFPDGSPATTITLAAQSGLVVRRAAGATQPSDETRGAAEAQPGVAPPAGRDAGRLTDSPHRRPALRSDGYRRAGALPRNHLRRASVSSSRAFPAGDRFWTWARWNVGAGEFKGRKRDARVRPVAAKRVPDAWWTGLRRFLRARRAR
jgi:Hypothetical glycosyl hydrolase family 15